MAQTTNSSGINTDQGNNKSLSIQVRLDGFSFLIQDQSGLVLEHKSLPFTKVSPNNLLKEVYALYQEESLLSKPYSRVTIIYVNELFTLVPEPLFDEAHLTDYLKFNTRLLKTDFVAYDTIVDQEIVNVYIPYTNLNNFFFDQYGSFSYYHGMSVLLETHLNQPAETLPKLVVNVHQASFDLIAIRDGKLVLANSFMYQTKEDFIYYLLFTIEQLELDPETLILQLTGHITKGDPTYELAYTYIREVQVLPSLSESIPQQDYLLSTLL